MVCAGFYRECVWKNYKQNNWIWMFNNGLLYICALLYNLSLLCTRTMFEPLATCYYIPPSTAHLLAYLFLSMNWFLFQRWNGYLLSCCLQRGQQDMILSHWSTHWRWNICEHGSCLISSFSLYFPKHIQHSCIFSPDIKPFTQLINNSNKSLRVTIFSLVDIMWKKKSIL